MHFPNGGGRRKDYIPPPPPPPFGYGLNKHCAFLLSLSVKAKHFPGLNLLVLTLIIHYKIMFGYYYLQTTLRG